LFTLEKERSETPDNISCSGFDDGFISEGERGPSRFDLLEKGFQSATERNSSHTSVRGQLLKKRRLILNKL
jgi:hypothetical protein